LQTSVVRASLSIGRASFAYVAAQTTTSSRGAAAAAYRLTWVDPNKINISTCMFRYII
jgi:hypothetical protein